MSLNHWIWHITLVALTGWNGTEYHCEIGVVELKWLNFYASSKILFWKVQFYDLYVGETGSTLEFWRQVWEFRVKRLAVTYGGYVQLAEQHGTLRCKEIKGSCLYVALRGLTYSMLYWCSALQLPVTHLLSLCFCHNGRLSASKIFLIQTNWGWLVKISECQKCSNILNEIHILKRWCALNQTCRQDNLSPLVWPSLWALQWDGREQAWVKAGVPASYAFLHFTSL